MVRSRNFLGDISKLDVIGGHPEMQQAVDEMMTSDRQWFEQNPSSGVMIRPIMPVELSTLQAIGQNPLPSHVRVKLVKRLENGDQLRIREFLHAVI